MKFEVSVDELQFGVYIAELDRPWTETPFVFQGFELKTEEELQTLRKYCKKVFIDVQKGLDLPDRRKRNTGPVSAHGGPSVLAHIKKKFWYEEIASVEAELPRARQVHGRANAVLEDIFAKVRSGEALDSVLSQTVNDLESSAS